MIVKQRYQVGDPHIHHPTGHKPRTLNVGRMTTIVRDPFDEGLYLLTAAIIRQAAIDYMDEYYEQPGEHPAYAFLSYAGYLEAAPELARMSRYVID